MRKKSLCQNFPYLYLILYIIYILNLPHLLTSLLPVLFQESRDPRKLHWLFELLLESPLSGEGGSFVDAW